MTGRFKPRKPLRTFRDLEVYQKTLAASVIVSKDLREPLEKVKYPMLENFVNCAMTIPLTVAQAHSLRFGKLGEGEKLLEQAMAGCNKMVVYLEQMQGIYGKKLDSALLEDLTNQYLVVRRKLFHLLNSWKKFKQEGSPFSRGKPKSPLD